MRWVGVSWRGAVALVVAVALISTSAGRAVADEAADKATARELFYDASNAMKAGDHAKAAELFARSDRLYPTPTAALGEARALVQLGRLVAAYDRYQTILTRPLPGNASDAFREAVESARAESATIEAQVPRLTVTVEPGVAARVELDGAPLRAEALGVKRPVEVGVHRVTATSAGRAPFSTELRLAAGESKQVVIQFAPGNTGPASSATGLASPASEPSADGDDGTARRTIGWVLVGLGGAGIATWAVSGIVYLNAQSTVDTECDDGHFCSQAGLDAADRAQTVGVVNTVALFGGLACAGAGVALVLTAPSSQPSARVQTKVTAQGGWLGVTGRF